MSNLARPVALGSISTVIVTLFSTTEASATIVVFLREISSTVKLNAVYVALPSAISIFMVFSPLTSLTKPVALESTLTVMVTS